MSKYEGLELTAEEIAWCDEFDSMVAEMRKAVAKREDVRSILGPSSLARLERGEGVDFGELTADQRTFIHNLAESLAAKSSAL